MQFLAEGYRNYPPSVRETIVRRKQWWDRRSQFYAVTQSPYTGQKLPCCVKFPRLSSKLEKLPRNHPWSKHRLGRYNGMYFIPPEENEHQVVMDDVFRGNVNITEAFFNSPKFKLLQQGFELMYKKVKVNKGGRPAYILLRNDNHNFSTDDKATLQPLGNFYSFSFFINSSKIPSCYQSIK